jgi:transposase-like protein
MTVNNTLGAAELLRKYLESPAGSNLLGEMVKMAAELLMDADVDVLCNAGYGERTDARENSRNGHRERRWDTRAGTISLDVPKLRHGSYMPGLLEPRRRVEQALVSVVCQAYIEGVSTRRVDDLVKSMGIDGMSKSQVSELAKNLDERVAEFRNRPLDVGPYAYLWLDARGLSGVALVVSDAHEGLKGAIAAVLDGASWQRCRTHAMRNLLTRVPKSAQGLVATLVRTIFAQPDVTQVHAQFNRVVDQLEAQFPAVAEILTDAEGDLLAFSAFPPEHWRQIWSNNPQERLNREIRRRTDVVGIFPNRAACIRLVGAVLAEQHDEWAIARRYMSQESLAKTRVRVIVGGAVEKEVDATAELEAVS